MVCFGRSWYASGYARMINEVPYGGPCAPTLAAAVVGHQHTPGRAASATQNARVRVPRASQRLSLAYFGSNAIHGRNGWKSYGSRAESAAREGIPSAAKRQNKQDLQHRDRSNRRVNGELDVLECFAWQRHVRAAEIQRQDQIVERCHESEERPRQDARPQLWERDIEDRAESPRAEPHRRILLGRIEGSQCRGNDEHDKG